MGKRYKKKDPHRKREAQKYEFPVPSREFILDYYKKKGKPIALEEVIKDLDIKDKDEKEGMRRRLSAMERDGQLMRDRRGQYALVDRMSLIAGRVLGHRDGFGFFIPDDGSPDIFLPEREMRQVFTDDRVLVQKASNGHRKKSEGRIIEVLERRTTRVVGRYIEERGLSFVAPDSKTLHQDIMIAKEDRGNAKPGQYVVAEILQQPTKRRAPCAKVVDVLGDQLTPGMEVELAIRAHDLPFEWPKAMDEALESIEETISDEDIKKRKDLRALPLVTIDGADAKDFDDAVHCEIKEDGSYRLTVAIADVSHYVHPNDVLDEEAYKRGNSVYFPAKVIPMLPEVLSNNLCSLKPRVDRLALVCQMDINKAGQVTHFTFDQAVIHSHERFTYDRVAKMLASPEDDPHPLYSDLVNLRQLFECLVQNRRLRGAIEFETTETRVVFDDEGKIDKLVPTERNIAHRMIEEAMLLANVTASNYIEQSKIPSLYRVHECPSLERLTALRDFLKVFGLRLTGGAEPTGLDYSKLIQRIIDRPDYHLLQTVILRSMQQAVYSPDNLGHFGLSYDGYTHFTSPIRRYPDLLVHRAIKHLIHNRSVASYSYSDEQMTVSAEHCSTTERRADRASRDALDWLKCDYMQDKLGMQAKGVVIDVTSFGIFVELCDTYVQGLVHITALKSDYYEHDATHHVLIGRRSGRRYQLGQALSVRVARVDMHTRKIDFDIIE